MTDAAAAAAIQTAYNDLNAPSAAKLGTELRKRGVRASAAQVQTFVRAQAERQLFAARPKPKGKISSDNKNDLWMADLIDFSSTASTSGSSYILVVQDVYSRKVWAKTLVDKQPGPVGKAYATIAREHGPPLNLRTDAGNEFVGTPFQAHMDNKQTVHNIKTTKNGLATLDRAIGEIKRGITRAMSKSDGDDWAAFVDKAVAAFNASGHEHLLGGNFAPNEAAAETNDELTFSLRKQAAQANEHNMTTTRDTADKLTGKAFRAPVPRTNLPERSFKPKFEGGAPRRVARVEGSTVIDEHDNRFPAGDVIAVPIESTTATAPKLDLRRVDGDTRALADLQTHKPAIAAFIRRPPGRNSAPPKTIHQVVVFMRGLGITPANNKSYSHLLELLGFKVNLEDGAGWRSTTVTLT
jgi:hypothetical protein